MPYADFRAFLDVLRAHGELIDIDRPVDLYLEVGKALRKTSAVGGPALNFTQNGTEFPLVGGLYNTRSKALLAFESDEAHVFEKISGRAREADCAGDDLRQSGDARCRDHRRRYRSRDDSGADVQRR